MTTESIARRIGVPIGRDNSRRFVLRQLEADTLGGRIGEHKVLALDPERRLVAPRLDVDPLRLWQAGDDPLESFHVVHVDMVPRLVGRCPVPGGGVRSVSRYPRPVLHHLTLWVPDLNQAEQSWGWLLGELGYVVDRSLDRVVLFRHGSGFAVALEQSPDMVPGMLYSRLRPGLNHLAFTLDSSSDLSYITSQASDHGWLAMPADRHPIAGGAQVAYLEDRDGFEVELVVMGAASAS
jgi:catechol 2,3-dioxygenase-like lactoylglutathione lyase family enzyme